MLSSMRPTAFPALLILLLLRGGALHAQVQERKLMDTILPPDMSLAYSAQGKTFYSGGAAGMDSAKSANVKEFYISQKFFAKSFETRDYAARGYWQGDFQFSTKAANVKAANEAGKVYETKAAAVKTANESGKEYATRGYATREAMEKGKTSQAHLDEEALGASQMNMDQVRDLLNKNHRVDLTPIDVTPGSR
jgi:hypothetical protein